MMKTLKKPDGIVGKWFKVKPVFSLPKIKNWFGIPRLPECHVVGSYYRSLQFSEYEET